MHVFLNSLAVHLNCSLGIHILPEITGPLLSFWKQEWGRTLQGCFPCAPACWITIIIYNVGNLLSWLDHFFAKVRVRLDTWSQSWMHIRIAWKLYKFRLPLNSCNKIFGVRGWGNPAVKIFLNSQVTLFCSWGWKPLDYRNSSSTNFPAWCN